MGKFDLARLKEGLPHPLGATWDGKGTNFALFSANATKVEVCLFDETGEDGTDRIELPEYTDQIFHGYLPGVAARPASTATACTAPTSRRPATASIRTSCCSIPMRARTWAS